MNIPISKEVKGALVVAGVALVIAGLVYRALCNHAATKIRTDREFLEDCYELESKKK
jgi:hypothetical protein